MRSLIRTLIAASQAWTIVMPQATGGSHGIEPVKMGPR